jgi:DNA polymerase-3 subunit epsilon
MQILVVDIETTGFVPETGSIVEVAMVLVDTKTKEIKTLFNEVLHDDNFGEHSKNAWIFSNSTLTYNEVRDSKHIEHYRPQMQSILNQYQMTAFNKKFDLSFLRARGFKCNDLGKCIMESTKEYLGILYNEYKNPSVVKAYRKLFNQPEYEEDHRANQDCIDEAKILLKLVELKTDPKIKSILVERRNGNYVPYNTKTIPEPTRLPIDKINETKDYLKNRSIVFQMSTNNQQEFIFSYKGTTYLLNPVNKQWGVIKKGNNYPLKFYGCASVEQMFKKYLDKDLEAYKVIDVKVNPLTNVNLNTLIDDNN